MSISFKIKKTQLMGRVLFLVLTFTTVNSFATGTRDGGGGDGIELTFSTPGLAKDMYTKTFLLDLFEYGVHETPVFNKSIAINPAILKRVTNALPELDQNVSSLVAQKLSEIHAYDVVTAAALIKGMEMYTWRLMNAKLVDIEDDDGSDVDIDRKNLVQLAIRNSRTIRLSKPRLVTADNENISALVMHEVIFAMLPPKQIESNSGNYEFQQSKRAREITGYLYSNYFKSKGAKGFHDMIGSDLPTTSPKAKLVLEKDNYLYLVHAAGYSAPKVGTSETATKDLAKFLCDPKISKSQWNIDFLTTPIAVYFSEYNKSPTIKQSYILWEQYRRTYSRGIEFNTTIINSSNCQADMEIEIENQLQKEGYTHDF